MGSKPGEENQLKLCIKAHIALLSDYTVFSLPLYDKRTCDAIAVCPLCLIDLTQIINLNCVLKPIYIALLSDCTVFSLPLYDKRTCAESESSLQLSPLFVK